jgi:alkyl hydroperoxide reductase subunit AhpC
LRAWHDKYERSGLIVIGIHSPEFFWEKSLAKVKAESERLGIKFPVVQDNDFDNWNRYGIRAWPSIVLIDRQGIIRHSHIGEGAYQKTEAVIKQLLAEPS